MKEKKKLKSMLLMLKLAQTILTELSEQIITRAVTPADCGERKPLACRGKELTCGDDSPVKESVIFSLCSAAGSTDGAAVAPCTAPGCLLQPLPHGVLAGWGGCSVAAHCHAQLRFATLEVQQLPVFDRCLSEMFKELAPVHSPPQQRNKPPKNRNPETYTGKNLANCNESLASLVYA